MLSLAECLYLMNICLFCCSPAIAQLVCSSLAQLSAGDDLTLLDDHTRLNGEAQLSCMLPASQLCFPARTAQLLLRIVAVE